MGGRYQFNSGYLVNQYSRTLGACGVSILWPDREADNGNEYLITINDNGHHFSIVVIGDWEMDSLVNISEDVIKAINEDGTQLRFIDKKYAGELLMLLANKDNRWSIRLDAQQPIRFVSHASNISWPADECEINISNECFTVLIESLSKFSKSADLSSPALIIPNKHDGSALRGWLSDKEVRQTVSVFGSPDEHLKAFKNYVCSEIAFVDDIR